MAYELKALSIVRFLFMAMTIFVLLFSVAEAQMTETTDSNSLEGLTIICDLDHTLFHFKSGSEMRLHRNLLGVAEWLDLFLPYKLVPGMAETLRLAQTRGARIVFVSSRSPGELTHLRKAIDRIGFNSAEIHLMEAKIGHEASAKISMINGIIKNGLGALKYILIGDNYEKDPFVYNRIRETSNQILDIYVRRVIDRQNKYESQIGIKNGIDLAKQFFSRLGIFSEADFTQIKNESNANDYRREVRSVSGTCQSLF